MKLSALKGDEMDKFKELYTLNVETHVEKKQNLRYLSWAWAWAEFIQIYPDAVYEITKNENNLPYFESDLGAMVYTSVTAGGVTHGMWLPVMDGANNAQKKHDYEYTAWDNYKKQHVKKLCKAYDMFDINKSVMRCLVKNLAMFGLGLYIYAGEDLPESESIVEPVVETKDDKKIDLQAIKDVVLTTAELDSELAKIFPAKRHLVKPTWLPKLEKSVDFGNDEQKLAALTYLRGLNE